MWEENWPTINAFFRVRTQWRTGASGATGLDYQAVNGVLARMRLKDEDEVFAGLQLMESTILSEWGRQSERRAREMKARR